MSIFAGSALARRTGCDKGFTPAGGCSFTAALFWPGAISTGATPAGGRRMMVSLSAGAVLSGMSKAGDFESEFSTLKSTETSLLRTLSERTPGPKALRDGSPSARAGVPKPTASTVARPVAASNAPCVFFTLFLHPIVAAARILLAQEGKAFEISALCAASKALNLQHAVYFAQRH